MIYSELRIAALSDIHLGHRRTPTSLIAANLKAAFPFNAETAKLDVIVLAGDVFDRLLNLPQDEVEIIEDVVMHFLKLSATYGIDLWMVEGTPDHDRKQSRLFVKINRMYDVGASLTYVEKVDIVYFPKFGVNVLFVPDVANDTAEKTLAQVHELLRIHKLDKVDYAVMHGQFEYQLPPVVKAQKHSSDAYLSLVKYLIFIGHVHQHNKKERILPPGSFDRLTHGDEYPPKGHLRCVVRAEDDYEVLFVENKGAKIYKTIDCTALDLQAAMQKVKDQTLNLPDYSDVRIRAEKGHPILMHVDEFQREYNLFHWEAQADLSEEEINIKQAAETEETYVPVAITRDNISEMLIDSMLSRNADPEIMALAEQKFMEIR